MLHKNSQKRIYAEGKIYSITMVVHKRAPFFREQIFCQLLFNVIKVCRQFHEFEFYGIVILFDHVHLMVKPISCDVSKLIGFIKRHTSRNINELIKFNFYNYYYTSGVEFEGRNIRSRLQIQHLSNEQKQIILWMEEKIKDYKSVYNAKYPKPFHTKFKWQAGFRDHYIRNEQDFLTQLNYIKNNPVKHELINSEKNWPWLIIRE